MANRGDPDDMLVQAWKDCFAACIESQRGVSIRSSLSSEQNKSLSLLVEWWHYEESVSDLELQSWFAEPKATRFPVFDQKGGYRQKLFRLWLWEFSGLMIGANGPRFRQEASVIAAAHRLAFALYSGLLANNPQTESRKSRVKEPPLSACMEFCPWLNPAQQGREYPHYLWNIRLRRTVECPAGGADYLVVSHTWGRWRTSGDSVKVQGVPWRVPQNTIFDVTTLPDILSHVPFETEYVWFDLVCIPQDGSELQAIEIARQAAIFASAKWATVWFNRIRDWTGFRQAVTWLCSRYFTSMEVKPSGGDRLLLSKNVDSAATASQTTGMAHLIDETSLTPTTLHFWRDEGSSRKYMIPDGWFTSLWTLQETCLRPDLALCNANWEVFVDDPSSPLACPVTLDSIIALMNAVCPSIPRFFDLPLAVFEVVAIFTKTALHKLNDMSPIDVLAFGNQRYCEDANRALAIMSALGTTSWYTAFRQRAASASPEQLVSTFVHGRYPVEFIKEVIERFGGPFFVAADFTNLADDFYGYGLITKRLTWTALEATLMPFTQDIRRQRFVPHQGHAYMTTPDEVMSWQICTDGSVDISDACVIASYPGGNAFKLRALVCAWVPGRKHFKGEVDISDWLASFRPMSQKYALAVYHEDDGDHVLRTGIILERVYDKFFKKRFIKIGVWFANDIDLDTEGNVRPIPKARKIDIKVI
ncbi:hypothetical protein F4860DRAFT_520410 [Xylaria cubensis]|nr:hypothetical protein F4860DRAFT_520410 [Xylaria cubensis]